MFPRGKKNIFIAIQEIFIAFEESRKNLIRSFKSTS
jgi:hypothetical protein